ncbi:MAG: glycosyltransferase [Bacteroidales bacterium]|jgi:glycosyltransferase involved in cell wall biosynthesis|nr:glycosyltransferase [Bacteroidales bacterium]
MPDKNHKQRVAFSVTNCICFDQRVLRITETVSHLEYNITIIGRRLGDCCDSGSVPFKTKRFRMIFKKGFLFYKFFNIRLFFFLLFHRYDLLVANDLDTLLPNFLVSRIKGIALVYDSHEYFTGVPEIQDRHFVKWVWTSIEKMVFPRLRNVMTVCDSIAEKYEVEYGLRPLTVRNISKTAKNISGFSRDELGIAKEHLLLILQGGGINTDRGGEELIEAISKTENVSLLIVGSGDVLQILNNRVMELNLSERVRFIPKVPWQELLRYTKSADAGLSLDKNTNPNYTFSLPNKLFDYISAGIPVIASDLIEIKRIVEGNMCGIIIPAVTADEISIAVKKLRDDRDFLNKLKQNTVNASKYLNWEKESEKVIDFYSNILH